MISAILITTAYVICLVFWALALSPGSWAGRASKGVERILAGLGNRPVVAMSLLFVATAGVRLCLLPVFPKPQPQVHDEFGYLLLADTLMHGRLANPTPPIWKSLETYHVNMVPAYASQYPPAQGIALAAGELIGDPWFGVLLSVGAMAVAIYWALAAMLPRRWAFLAAAMAVMKLGLASYWMNSYWGGAPAAIGGSLAIGGMVRLVRRASIPNALALGLGIAILSNSRPYEGALFCIPIAVVLVFWALGKTKRPGSRKDRLLKGLLPVTAILLADFAFIGYYNWRTTHNPFELPVMLSEKQNDPSAIFIWQAPKPPMPHNNKQFDDFYNVWVRDIYKRTWLDLLVVTGTKIRLCSKTYLWMDLLLVVPGFYFVFKRPRFRVALAAGLACIGGFFLLTWSFPHYIAPATVVIFGAIVLAIRQVRLFRVRRYEIGLLLCRLTFLGLATSTVVSLANGGMMQELARSKTARRTQLSEQLMRMPGKHLVIVRYAPGHNEHVEWVYNGADLQESKIVWARELGAKDNAALIDYFKDRQVWLVEPDRANVPIRPYVLPRP